MFLALPRILEKLACVEGIWQHWQVSWPLLGIKSHVARGLIVVQNITWVESTFFWKSYIFKNRHFLKNAWSAHLHESGLCQNRLLVRWWRRWLTWVCVCACVCVMTVAVTVISHCVCGSQLLFGVAIGDCTGSCFSLRCWRRVTSWWLRCERSLTLLLLLLMLWNWNIATSYSPRNCFSTVLGRTWEAACCVVSWLTQWFTFKCDSQSLYFKRC